MIIKGTLKISARCPATCPPAFIKGIEDNLPKAAIVFDRFHVTKVINEAVDKVRKAEVANNPILKNTRYLFLKNRDNLTIYQRQRLEEIQLSGLNLKTMKALNIREAFQQIYQAPTPQIFDNLLRKWYFWATHSRIEPIKEAAKSKARGYRRFDTIKAIIYLLTGKLDFSRINPHYVTHLK